MRVSSTLSALPSDSVLTRAWTGLQKALSQLVEPLSEAVDGVPLRKAQAMLDELVTGLDAQEKEFEAVALGESPVSADLRVELTRSL